MKKQQRPIVPTLAKTKPLTKRTAKLLREEGHAWNHVLRYEWIYLLMFVVGAVLLIFFLATLATFDSWYRRGSRRTVVQRGRHHRADGKVASVDAHCQHGENTP